MTLLQKMFWLFSAVGVIVMGVGIYSFGSLRSARLVSDEVASTNLERLQAAAILRSEIFETALLEARYLQKGAVQDQLDQLRLEGQVREHLASFEALAGPDERARLGRLGESLQSAFAIYDRARPGATGKIEGSSDDPTAASASVDRQMEELVHDEETVLSAKIHGISSGFQGAIIADALLFLVIFAGMGVTFFGGKSAFTAIANMTKLILEITATGALDRKLEFDRGDEVGTLAKAFNQMVESLRSMVRQMQEATANLTSTGSQILAATSQQSASATEQAASVSEATATIEEIRQTAEQAAERAQEMIGMADRSEQVSQTGAQAVSQSVQGINEVRTRVDSIATNILTLSERTQQIGDIIATVTELAERSNLLAVNASIEAAKAGEHGRGFAVVAREVHSLADQSKIATKQIRTILGEIQKATNDAVMVTEEGTKRAEVAVKRAEQAGSNIQELAQAIQVTAQAARQIATSSRQQSVGIDQIVLAFKHINQATAESVAGARQTETSAAAIKELSDRMRSIVVSYRL